MNVEWNTVTLHSGKTTRCEAELVPRPGYEAELIVDEICGVYSWDVRVGSHRASGSQGGYLTLRGSATSLEGAKRNAESALDGAMRMFNGLANEPSPPPVAPAIELAAKAAHAVNNLFCGWVGDPPSPPWNELSPEVQRGVYAGVRHALEGGTPQSSHDLWLQSRAAEGWTYGETKDFVKKTSPNMKPYDELPVAQKTKDVLFQDIVRAVTRALWSST